MSESVGRAHIELYVDGHQLPRQIRQFAKTIAKEGELAGDSYGDGFLDGALPRMRKAADQLGEAFGDSFAGQHLEASLARMNAKIDQGFNKASRAAQRFSVNVRDSLDATFPEADLSLAGIVYRLDEAGDRVRSVGRGMQDFLNVLDESDFRLRGMNVEWRDLSHNTRQWTLILGSAAAGMQQIAGLSSSLGAGVFALGGALTSAVAGVGGIAAVFSKLAGDINEMDEPTRSIALQMRNLGTELIRARDTIADNAFPQMANTFSRMETSVASLTPELAELGRSTGKVMDGFSRSLAVGSDGLYELRRMVGLAAKDFPPLADAAGGFTLALMRGVNEANPLVEQFIGYFDTLGERLDKFTRSSAFNTWIATSSQTLSGLGALIDSVGRGLNDLVTPESVVRTQEFLDNLSGFMPYLSDFLGIVGELDAFGLLAQALREVGETFAPLAGPLSSIAGFINDIASALIDNFSVAMSGVMTVITPVVQGLENVVQAFPDELIDGWIGQLGLLAGAMIMLRGVQGIAGVVGSLGVMSNAMTTTQTNVGKLAGALQTGLGKLGAIGAVAGVVFTVGEAVKSYAWELSGVEGKALRAMESSKSFGETLKIVNEGNLSATTNITRSWDELLTKLGDFDNIWSGFDLGMTSGENPIYEELNAINIALDASEQKFADLATNNLPLAIDMFSSWAQELGATDEQVLNMLNKMEPFKAVLESVAIASGGLGTEQEILDIALGRTEHSIGDNTDALGLLRAEGELTQGQVERLADSIRNFGSSTLDTRSAARDFQESLLELQTSLTENGATLDITTQQGIANEAAIDDLIKSTLEYSASLLEETNNHEAANQVIEEGRAKLEQIGQQFGLTEADILKYSESLKATPEAVDTKVKLNGVKEANDAIADIIKNRVVQISANVSGVRANGGWQLMATGGLVDGATPAIIGEAGPEAVVPLDRPLSQVDPDVRWLSAIAQGYAPAPSSTGAGEGVSRPAVIFEAGAIVVQESADARRTAIDVANEIAEMVSS